MIDAGPEDVAAFGLHRRGHPRLARRRGAPDEAAVPRRIGGDPGLAGIGDAQLDLSTRGQRFGQFDRQPALGVGPAVGGDHCPVDGDLGNGQQGVQLDGQPFDRGGGCEVQHRNAVDGLVVRHDLQRQIGLVEPHGQLFGRARLVRAQRESRRFARRDCDSGFRHRRRQHGVLRQYFRRLSRRHDGDRNAPGQGHGGYAGGQNGQGPQRHGRPLPAKTDRQPRRPRPSCNRTVPPQRSGGGTKKAGVSAGLFRSQYGRPIRRRRLARPAWLSPDA